MLITFYVHHFKTTSFLKNITNYLLHATINSLQVSGKINKLFQSHEQDENVPPNHLQDSVNL